LHCDEPAMTAHSVEVRPPIGKPVDFDPFASSTPSVSLPLTDAQQEVWMAAQLGGNSAVAYNESVAFQVTGPISVESMRTAAERLAARHEALRVTFTADGMRQKVSSEARLPVEYSDLSELGREEREQEAARLVASARETPFDLVSGPLARISIVRTETDRHLLIFTVHHLICDGWSFGILLHELAELYTTDRHGLMPSLTEPARYTTHVERALEADEARATSEAYWLERLKPGVPALELPTDRPRSAGRTFRTSEVRHRIEPRLYAALKEAAGRHHCTMYVMLLAAWRALIWKLTGQRDLIIGLPIAGQASLSDSNLVGHFVQMLPVPSAVDGAASFTTLLRQAREDVLDAREHQFVTLGRLLQKLDLARDPARPPLISAVFNVDKAAELPCFAGLQLEPHSVPRAAGNFEFAADMTDTGVDCEISCYVNADLIDADSARRWLVMYELILKAVAADPDIRLAALPSMSDDERRQLQTWGNPEGDYPAACLHRTFEFQAAQNPDAIAASFENLSVSYGDLNRRANQLAHCLRGLGVGPDVSVGLAVGRSLDLVVAILGILKAGGAYLPLDPAYPRARLAFMLDDARPVVVVTTVDVLRDLPELPMPVVCMDRDRELIDAQDTDNLRTPVETQHLAYIIYTSGSTGRPKGVLVEHRQAARLFTSTDALFHFGPSDVWTLFHSAAFDFSVWELWGALLYGGRLVIVPYWTARSPETFRELLCREHVTVLNQTPTAFGQLMEADRLASSGDLALRLVIFGGEALDMRALGTWVTRHGDAAPALVNMYGITETTVHTTHYRVLMDDVSTGGSVIGRPLSDLSIQVLDAHGNLAPIGVPGEICVGGAGVARGYLDRASLTAERFVPDASDRQPGARLYRSGDLARWRQNGQLEYLGRIDQQVKIRGFRVELGEIAAALNEHPGVRESAVILESDGDSRLAAYVVLQDGVNDREATVADIRAQLSTRLPDYMIPGAIAVLERLPLTANGKLDRKALPHASAPRGSGDSGENLSTTEHAIADIWAEVLSVPRPGRFDSFFDLGGHSVLAARMIARLRETFTIDLPISALFRARTIALLAKSVEAAILSGAEGRAADTAREVVDL
jgi:amino acid adenylation domain-containing protein